MAGERGLAEQIRAGLEERARPKLMVISAKRKIHPLDELWVNKPIRQHIREFGAVFALILLIIAGVKLYNHSQTLTPYYCMAGAAIFLILGYGFPSVLKPIWQGWMKFAMALGLVMTTVIVGIAWFGMLVPIALLLKLFGKQSMDLSFRIPVTTYWEERDPLLNDFKLLERQY